MTMLMMLMLMLMMMMLAMCRREGSGKRLWAFGHPVDLGQAQSQREENSRKVAGLVLAVSLRASAARCNAEHRQA
ncbi:hypothetical protein EX30DRAFT_337107 [Ascodesmis nigricans]|uniref:Secreted protein n=1 Tax=Ascodesmis nigricans TaxID=341454 RepID=A0A4S2N6A1_9PEZI|nr:hypothetical protein EX30DRAFT_337107 [Ascodesmis nigricans]